MVGLEPTRPFGQRILSAPRLPFRHTGSGRPTLGPRRYRRLCSRDDQEQTTAAPRRVVVAEDESLIRLDIVEILRDNGFDVVGEAGDGETAVALATELRPDLVIMDVKMPQLDGISAAERLSEEPHRPGRAADRVQPEGARRARERGRAPSPTS